MRNVLIVGIDSVLGSYFAARCLENTHDHVFYLPQTADDVLPGGQQADLPSHIASLAAKGAGGPQEIKQRLQQVGGDSDAPVLNADVRIDEVWYFASSGDSRESAKLLDGVMAACARAGAKELNYVALDATGSKDEKKNSKGQGASATAGMTDGEILQHCGTHGLQCRIFRTSMVLGHGRTAPEQAGAALSKFFSVLHSFKAEIDGRSPQYFDFKALRYIVPADARVNLLAAGTAADLLLRIARKEGTMGSSFSIASPQNTAFPDLCERIGIAYNLSIVPAVDLKELNAIDRAFQQQLDEANAHMVIGALEFSPEAYALAGLPPESAVLDEQAQIELFESVRRVQDKALAARRRRAADLPGRLERKTLLKDQSELNYSSGGTAGPAVVVLNALGQGMEYWYRLLDNLVETHRVIIWDPRGTVSPASFVLTDQVDDLDAVLRQEGIENCHVIGWCTGPKVAIEFHQRRPAVVRSMAFLNCTLKCDGSPEELDSAYERNLESLFRMVVRKPAMAASVRKTLQEPKEQSETEILEDSDIEQMSVNVLSMMNEDLKDHVLAPFSTEQTTLNYANQMVDFWKHDLRTKAAEVQVPVLLLSAEYDQVATPEASVAAAGIFPRVRHVHAKGATHYCLYDRPEFVARLLRTFFADPDSFVVREQGAPSRNVQGAAPQPAPSPDAGAPPQAVAILS